MNSDDMEDIMLHAYLGLAASIPNNISNPQITLSMQDGQTKLKIEDGATGYTQEHQTRTKKLNKKLEKLEQAQKEKRRQQREKQLKQEMKNSDTLAGEALAEKVAE